MKYMMWFLILLLPYPSYASDFYWGAKVAYSVTGPTDETKAVRDSLPLDFNTDNDFSSLMIGIYAGYEINDWLAFEVEYSNQDGEAGWKYYDEDTKYGTWANVENDIDRYTFSVVPTFYKLSRDWSLYGRVGAVYAKTNYSDPAMSVAGSNTHAWVAEYPAIYNFQDESEWSGIVGVGGIFQNEYVFLRVEVRQDFNASTEVHLDTGYRF